MLGVKGEHIHFCSQSSEFGEPGTPIFGEDWNLIGIAKNLQHSVIEGENKFFMNEALRFDFDSGVES